MDGMLVGKLVAAAVGVGLAAYGARLHARATVSARWPGVAGTILAVRLHEQQGEDDPERWSVEVEYEYQVGGAVFRNNVVGIGNERPEVSGRAALELGDRYPLLSPVTVRYDPANPALAVLEPGDARPALAVVGTGALVTLFSLLSLLL